ncbi:para-nitrobenzyl esterase [Puntigrus tetrazona]|uniref:para-nitrobenzyl esterase n=1 Tax=Puntigrus tetrazona TaxID=1606681 RepID=UPI001C8935AF|nr:para-nitrobenzyl esterase [Puntigrus tetrazona]XP_043120658.1 para-nitrobenzyl esterase [Puntigrus tetrazona]
MSEDVYEVPEGTEYRYLVQDEEEEQIQYVRRHYVSPFLVVSRKCMFLIGCGVIALLSLAGYLAYVAETPPPRVAEVQTECGRLRGSWKGGAYSFKGIPYAVPPVGERRWRPPADLFKAGQCWRGVYDATRFRSICAQVQPLRKDGQVMGQEDCLHLSVWTPSLKPAKPLPVMVWIHGGYLHMLSGQEKGYSPTEELAARTQMVYVSLNYRLNAFGFMALEMLREGSPTNSSGNYGFMDQIQALQWVQRNIHDFGGDAGRVTIFGQSSGGTSVWTLMMSPLAKGLFHRAIDMSGSYVYNASLESAERDNLEFLRRTGCKNAICLRDLHIAQVLQAIPWQQYPAWAADEIIDLPVKGVFIGPVAVVDNYVLKAPPFETWEKGVAGTYNDVPFVVGTTEQETDFAPPYVNISAWIWGDYQWIVKNKLTPFGEALTNQALRLYNSSAPCPTTDRCPERLFTTMVSDIRATCPNNDLAKRAAGALKNPVYRYLVTYTPSKQANTSSLLPFPSRFAFHLLDSLAFFGGLEMVLGTLSPADINFQEMITKYFVHFAKEGRMPEEWEEFPSRVALLDKNISFVKSYSRERCDLWEENGFYSYAWIN